MRPQGNLSDRLTVEIDCPSLGSSSECPSMASSFSPLDSPTPTPTSMYSQGSLASPGWHEGGSFAAPQYDRHSGSTPLRSAFRLADMTSSTGESMDMPYAMDTQDRMPMPEYLPGYDDSVEQFLIPSDMSKSYDNPHGMSYHSTMPSYPQMSRGQYRNPHVPYLPESATNPCLSRPIFQHTDRMPNSMTMQNMLPWLPAAEAMAPQTIAPHQAFPAPVTPPPSYSDFPASLSSFKQTPTTPVRSCSLGTPSGTETPMSRMSGSAGDYQEDYPLSPYRDGFSRGMQRQPSRKVSKKSSKQSLTLDNLPSIIKQVQFKCKEPGCKGRFKRQEHLKRHMKSHSQEKPHVCWVPVCHRAFSRSDNLNAHYTKTHSKRGGRNRYVATLDETSPDYDPDFRGQLTPDGRPIYGSRLEDPLTDMREFSAEA